MKVLAFEIMERNSLAIWRICGYSVISGHDKGAELDNKLLKAMIVKLTYFSFTKKLHIDISYQSI